MRLPKAIAAAYVLAVLALQAYVMVPPMNPLRGYYWPFVDYPMYSGAFHPGDRYMIHELRVIGCNGGPARALAPADLGLEQKFYLLRLLRGIATNGPGADQARETLTRVVRTRLPGSCNAEVWEYAIELGSDGPLVDEAAWRRAYRWVIPSPDETRSAGVIP